MTGVVSPHRPLVPPMATSTTADKERDGCSIVI